MRFNRSRTQVLYRYVPGSLFEHDKFGICLVTDVAVTAPDNLNTNSLQHALKAYISRWADYGGDAFPDPFTEWAEYKVGVPDRVSFAPFPDIVECSKCRHITTLEFLSSQGPRKQVACINCGEGRYRQLPYATLHNCGKLTSIPVVACPTHGKDHMTFIDTGRFVTAFWKCSICGQTRGMPRYQCQCNYSRKFEHASDYKKNMQYVRTNDTSVFYSHTIPLVNLPENLITSIQNDSRATGLILSRIYGLLDKSVFKVAEDRASTANQPTMNAQARALVEQILKTNPDSIEAKQLANLYSGPVRLMGDDVIDEIEAHLPGISQHPPSQSIIEHVAIIDGLDIITPEIAHSSSLERNDQTGAYDFEEGYRFARETLGFKWIGCITDFPIALVSVGYSRGGKLPGEALLNPFRSNRYDSAKVPLYTITSNTEGIMIQLDPQRVISWLLNNSLAVGETPKSEFEAWVWLKKYLPGLSEFRGLTNAPENLTVAEKAVLTLLHTISHLLMKQIEWSGFDPESVSEYILPETISLVIHSNNYSSFTIGGLVTLYEQRLHGWLRDTYNAAFNCVYNPICEDEGGSCAGCLHRQYNCEGFNSFLSRAVLQSGHISHLKDITSGYWTWE